ncbi:hydroxymethylbilane synthase [Mesonia sp. MT50]|uniref:Hydroxymethylbilane synthase n=1 Tax=Mesonia profundi TaxID=3070998 RepID=A0ABU0ZYT1_9FLAO|nr:hydroxymethylbilane synthase [Mesonia profundi]MDQ7916622.1 hydroxymethylbilane synthase [Mesonia profundi]
MSTTIRIGTRDSELALWQANNVKNKLEALGYKTQLLPVKSTGDLNLDQPLYEMGITGIFTKTLDIAMIKGDIDIAVHSMKDVPTALPKGIVQAAVLPRANVHDILLHKGLDFLKSSGTIATGSLRRKAQWLHHHPSHKIVNLRGNVNTRLRKLEDNEDWNGAIFAAAGLERINLKPETHQVLDWMTPAPAQGAMLIVVNESNVFAKEAVEKLNDEKTAKCVHVERDFLRKLEGGCTAPIGALAEFKNEKDISFTGNLYSLDGTQKIEEKAIFQADDYQRIGAILAQKVLDNGGRELMRSIKAELE